MILAFKRLFAYWLDFVLLVICLVVPQWLIFVLTSGFPFNRLNTGLEIELWVMLSISLPVWLYFVLFEVYQQQSFGKKLLKLVVVNDTGSKLTLKQAFLRTLIKLLPWELTHIIILIPEPWWSVQEPKYVFLIYIPNFIMLLYVVMLFVNKGVKGLHDYLPHTQVIQKPNS